MFGKNIPNPELKKLSNVTIDNAEGCCIALASVENTPDKTQIFYRIYLMTFKNKLYNITMSCLMSQKNLTNPVFEDVIKSFSFK